MTFGMKKAPEAVECHMVVPIPHMRAPSFINDGNVSDRVLRRICVGPVWADCIW
jgi:hypothetical protein